MSKIIHKSIGPIYVCSKCGCEYQAKFKDTTKCLTCCKKEHEEIHRKLKSVIMYK